MRRTQWSDQRLQRLFDSIARRFYPSHLEGWRVIVQSISDDERCWAYCDGKDRTIVVDLERIPYRLVRRVLYHEMVHALAPHGGHGLAFLVAARRLHSFVRIPANLNTDSGDCERGFRTSRTLIGAERRS